VYGSEIHSDDELDLDSYRDMEEDIEAEEAARLENREEGGVIIVGGDTGSGDDVSPVGMMDLVKSFFEFMLENRVG
jgi:hypothetical protein